MAQDQVEIEQERLEQDKQRLQDDLSRYDQAREQEREKLRQRARERAYERDRDRQEFYERERRRAAEAAQDERTYRTYERASGPTYERTYGPRYETATRPLDPVPDLVLKDVGRLSYAWIRTSIEAFMGINQAIGNLGLNLSDSIWGRQADVSPTIIRETPGSRRRSANAGRYEHGGKYEYRGRRDDQSSSIYDRSPDTRPFASAISIELSNAVRHSVAMFCRSAENFSRLFEQETARDDLANELDESC